MSTAQTRLNLSALGFGFVLGTATFPGFFCGHHISFKGLAIDLPGLGPLSGQDFFCSNQLPDIVRVVSAQGRSFIGGQPIFHPIIIIVRGQTGNIRFLRCRAVFSMGGFDNPVLIALTKVLDFTNEDSE